MEETGLRVLLVEDDDDNRELMAEVLAASGYEVLPAASGQDGLKMLSEHSIDAVVTDVGMPGMGGLEMARAAKAIAPTVPVVVTKKSVGSTPAVTRWTPSSSSPWTPTRSPRRSATRSGPAAAPEPRGVAPPASDAPRRAVRRAALTGREPCQ